MRPTPGLPGRSRFGHRAPGELRNVTFRPRISVSTPVCMDPLGLASVWWMGRAVCMGGASGDGVRFEGHPQVEGGGADQARFQKLGGLRTFLKDHGILMSVLGGAAIRQVFRLEQDDRGLARIIELFIPATEVLWS